MNGKLYLKRSYFIQ